MRIIIIILLVVLYAGCGHKQNKHAHTENSSKEKTYTCPMHPEIVRNKPGQCPICGMNLVERLNDVRKQEDTSFAILLKPVNTYVLGEIKTVNAEEMELPMQITVTGRINYDTREVKSVAARASGWIEKLYVKYRFQEIVKGQKLFDIYSRELATDQENFIYLLDKDSGNEPLIEAAEKKLRLQGLTPSQIEQIKDSKKIIRAITVYSPYSGHLHDLTVNSPDNTSMTMTAEANAGAIINEGMAVKKGQTVLNIYDVNRVWAVLDIPAGYVPFITKGISVNIQNDNERIQGKVDFVEKVGQDQKTRARIFLENKDRRLKIGNLVTATVELANIKGLFVPAEAVVHLGSSAVVFVKKGSVFYAKRIGVGIEVNGKIQVINGLNKYVEIASNGQMLMDSESFIREPHE